MGIAHGFCYTIKAPAPQYGAGAFFRIKTSRISFGGAAKTRLQSQHGANAASPISVRLILSPDQPGTRVRVHIQPSFFSSWPLLALTIFFVNQDQPVVND